MEINLKAFILGATVDRSVVRLTLEGEGGEPVDVMMSAQDLRVLVQKLDEFVRQELPAPQPGQPGR